MRRPMILPSELMLTLALPTLLFLTVPHCRGQQDPARTMTVPMNPQVEDTPPEDISISELLIGNNDLLQVSIFGSENFRQEVRVSSNGDVSLPLVGSVHVAGMSPHQAQELIRDKLVQGSFYRDPQVSVFVREYSSAGVYVLGEVQRPGFYPLLNVRRLLEAISIAGGGTPTAGRNVAITNPNRPLRSVTVTLSNDPGRSAEENVVIMPGDTIVVSKAGIVYVVGDVRMPTGVVMDRGGLTVLQAIAMAQGTNPTAALGNAKLIRKTGDSQEEITLSLKNILSGKAPDPPLRADDIVFVPTSVGKSVGRRTLETALQVFTGVAMYRRY